jgi:hypothetical protein
MSAVVRRATATLNSTSSSDLTQKRTTRASARSEPEPEPVVTSDAAASTSTKRQNPFKKVFTDTFYHLKAKAVDKVSRAFVANSKRAIASATILDKVEGTSTRASRRPRKNTQLKLESSPEKEASPVSTSVPSTNPQIIESVDPAPPPSSDEASKFFLSEGLYSNAVSNSKSKRTGRVSKAIRASKALAIESEPVTSGSTVSNKVLPLPLHWGLRKMEDQSEFIVPWDIMSEWQSGDLDSQKAPTKYMKLRKSESNLCHLIGRRLT